MLFLLTYYSDASLGALTSSTRSILCFSVDLFMPRATQMSRFKSSLALKHSCRAQQKHNLHCTNILLRTRNLHASQRMEVRALFYVAVTVVFCDLCTLAICLLRVLLRPKQLPQTSHASCASGSLWADLM